MDMTNKEAEINELLTRGVGDFFDPDGKFRDKLIKKSQGKYNKDIIIKFGIDPTHPNIHLGHTVILHKLRKFQEIGCKILFLIGDFTARIGDPSGKQKTRPEIEQKEVEANMKTYLEQVGKVISIDKTSFDWIRNSDWYTGITDINLPEDSVVTIEHKNKTLQVSGNDILGKTAVFTSTRMMRKITGGEIFTITLQSILWSLRHITLSQILKRDLFQDREKSGNELYLHELLYPVFQGTDSYVINLVYKSCDLEIGGTDQTFNMMMGRDAQRINKKELENRNCSTEEQTILSVQILEGTDSVQKMSKSLNNYIAITDTPEDMFGKVMSIKDELIVKYFTLCTFTPLSEIDQHKKEMESGKNPRDYKIKLAHEIVAIYHGEDKAKNAEYYFIKAFSKKEIPENIKTIEVQKGFFLSDILKQEGVVLSSSEFKRKTEEGAVRFINSQGKEKIIKDQKETFHENGTVRLGKFILGIKIKTP